MRAEDFITDVLHMEIERPRVSPSKKLSLLLRRYGDGRMVFVVPTSVDLDEAVGQRDLWHEVGHIIDNAHYLGGRSSSQARVTTGKYSTKNRALLRSKQQLLQEERKPPELHMSFKVGGKKYNSLEALEADPDVPSWFKVKMYGKVHRARMQMEDYLEQDIELFADGFAEYVMNPRAFARDPELEELYREVFAEKPALRETFGRHTVGKYAASSGHKRKRTRIIAGLGSMR